MEKRMIGWEINIGKGRKILPSIVAKLENFLNERWLPVIRGLGGSWWGIENLGIPSPVIRIDISPKILNSDIPPEKGIYEIEMRPAGLGIVLTLLPGRKKEWQEIFLSFNCRGIIHIESSIKDDEIAATMLGLPFYRQIPQDFRPPFWVRTNCRVGPMTELLERVSLVPICSDGNKSDLVYLGLAKLIRDEKDIEWKIPFVVKPLIGARMEGVEIYVPGSGSKDLPGVSTKSRIERTIMNNRSIILQEFIPPHEEYIEGKTG